jgi:chromosome segregation ATPase
MRCLVVALILGLVLTFSSYGQSIQLSQETLNNWIQALQRASLLLQASAETMTDLRNSLEQALLIQANLENSLQIAEAKQQDLEASLTASQDTLDKSQATIAQLKDLLTQSQKISSELSAKIAEQNKDIDNIAKDVKSLENQNTWLKIGIVAASAVAVSGIIYGLAK